MLFLMSCRIIYCQSYVKGEVYDLKDNTLVDFYTVLILDHKDSSVIRSGNFIEDGFKIECPPDDKFILKIRSFAYKDYIHTSTSISSKEIDLGRVFMEKSAFKLGELLVTASPPRIINRGDKLIIQVENTTISNAGNALDALQRTPLVMIDNVSKNISLAGRGNVLVLINGKRLYNSEELNTLNSSQIKQIEIIENPSSKYEAEGHAVINIVSSKNTFEGLSGNVYSRFTFDREASQNGSVDITYNAKKLILNGQYSIENNNSAGYNSSIERYNKLDYSFQSSNKDIETKYFMEKHNYKLGLEYELNKSSSINLETSGYWGDGGNNTLVKLEAIRNNIRLPSEFIRRNGIDDPRRNTLAAAYQFKNEGFDLLLVGNYTKSKGKAVDDICETDSLKTSENIMKSDLHSNYDLYTIKSDFGYPIKNIGAKIEFGGKYSYVKSNNRLVFSHLNSEEWIKDNNYSNSVFFKEEILGLYTLFSGGFDKFNYSLGLRYERTWNENKWDDKNKEAMNDVADNFFPNLSVSYKFKEDLSLRLSYTKRISRPSYSSLNNSLIYRDQYLSRQGNPELLPTFFNSISTNLSYKKISTSLTFSYIKDPIDLLYINDSIQIEKSIVKFLNVNNRWMFAYTMSGSFDKGIWNSQPFAAFEYSPYSITEDNEKYTTKRIMMYLRLNNQFRLKKRYSVDLNFLYMRPTNSYFKFGDQVVLDYGINKNFLNDKLIIQLSHHIAFLKWTQKLDYSYKYVDFTFDASSRNQLAISLRYKFNTEKKKYSGKSSNAEELRRL